jgi:hypothetical protein
MTEPAIERFLEEQFASLAEAAPSAYADSVHEGALTLISALGDLDLLSHEESERWTARLARASEDPLDRPLAAPNLRREANEYIERCLAEIEPEDADSSNDRWRVYGALEAFVEAGLLNAHQFERRQRQLWSQEAAPSDREEPLEAVSRFDMTHLMRIVPGPDERAGGLRVTVAELYADGVSIQWHRALGDGARRPWGRRRSPNMSLRADPPVRIADELGTAYRCAGGGSSRGSKRGEGELGRTDFVPAVPEQVRELLIQIGAETLAVPLH